jgi:O-antigen/teichoic acid export membrane protein
MMKSTRRPGVNAFIYLAGQSANFFLSFIFITSLARYFPKDQFGILSVAFSITYIMNALADLGLRQVITRDVSGDKSRVRVYANNALAIKLVLNGIIFIGFFAVMTMLHYPSEIRNIIVTINFSVIFLSFAQVFFAVYQGCERLEFETITLFMQNIFLLVGAFLIVFIHGSLMQLSVLYVGVSLSAMIFMAIVFIIDFGWPRFFWEFHLWRSLLKVALPFGLIGIFGMINHWIPTVIFAHIKGDAAAGIYNVVYRIFFVFLFIPTAFDMAFFPVMSRLHVNSKPELAAICVRILKYLLLLGVPIAVFGSVYAEKIIGVIFGAKYLPGVTALRILMWSALMIFISTPFSSLLNASSGHPILAKIVGCAAAITVIANLVFVPRYGYVGASSVSLFVNAFVTICVVYSSLKRLAAFSRDSLKIY